jgi:hypothetical protein
MDQFRLAQENARLDQARAEYRKALTAEREAGQPPVPSDGVKQATDEYDQALDAFIKFIVKEHDKSAAVQVEGYRSNRPIR